MSAKMLADLRAALVWIAKAPHLAGCQKTYGAQAGLAAPRCSCGRDELLKDEGGRMKDETVLPRQHQRTRQMGNGREGPEQ